MYLVWSGRAQSGVKGEVTCIAVGRLSFDIASTLSLGPCLTAAPGAAARQPVEGCVEPSCLELLANVDLVTPLPPAAVLWRARENLPGRIDTLGGLKLLSFTL